MKQRVTVTITTPSTAYSIKILAVHEVEGKLVVISEHNSGGWGGDSVSSASDSIVVKTSSNNQMPVLHYLTNISKESIENGYHLAYYGKGERYAAKDATEFTGVISDVSEIQELLAKGKCLYQPRKDKMIAARLGRCERNAGHPVKSLFDVPVTDEKFEAEKLQGIINIFPVVDDGSFKVVVETITNTKAKKSFAELEYAFDKNVQNAGSPALDLRSKLLMTPDDTFVFNASVNGKKARYRTEAVEFTLPTNDLGAYMQFMRCLEEVIRNNQAKMEEYSQPYTRIQVGHQSILSAFDELLICTEKDYRERDENFIEYPALISIDDFARHAVAADKLTATRLLTQAFTHAALPDYAAVQPAITDIFTEKEGERKDDGAAAVIYFPMLALEKILGESVMSLRDPKISLEEKQATVARMQAKLMDRDTFTKVSSLLQQIQNSFVSGIMMACLNKPAHDKGKYNFSYTELNLLFLATFRLREDGRVSMTHEGNAYYQKWYAEGRKNHDILEAELRFLGKVQGVDLEFAEGCDFHKEIIFTEACSKRLIAQGVLLNATNIGEQLKLSEPNQEVVVNQIDNQVPEEVVTIKTADVLQCKPVMQLMEQYPQSKEIIAMLQQAGVFTDDVIDARRILANLFHACDELSERNSIKAEKVEPAVNVEITETVDDQAQEENDDEELLPIIMEIIEKEESQKIEDTIESMVKLHKILLERGLLTEVTHKAIVGSVMRSKSLERVAELVNIIGEMDVKKAEAVFKGIGSIISIWNMIACFDEDNAALRHMINKVEDYHHYHGLWEMLACRQMDNHSLKFLRKQDFLLMIDNPEKCYDILNGLGHLARAGLLPDPTSAKPVDPTLRERFLALKDFDFPFHELYMEDMVNETMVKLGLDMLGQISVSTLIKLGYLQKAGILEADKDFVLAHQNEDLHLKELSHDKLVTSENLRLISNNPDYIKAEEFCSMANVIGWGSQFRKEKNEQGEKNVRQQLLANPQLTHAIYELKKVARFVNMRDELRLSMGEEGRRFSSELHELLKIAKVDVPAKKESVFLELLHKGLAFFQHKSVTLDECVARFKAKYKYQEPAPRQAEENTASVSVGFGM